MGRDTQASGRKARNSEDSGDKYNVDGDGVK